MTATTDVTTEKIGTLGGFKSLLNDDHIFKTMKKKDYPQFVTKVIRLLSSNSGLKLIFTKRSEEACFDPKNKIVKIPPPPHFPSTPDERKQFKEDLNRWRGILNHEVGHAMFTLWKASKKTKKIDSEKKMYPIKHHMFNDLFENGRMERVACEYFPGMQRDLQCLESFLGEIIKEMYKNDPKNFNHIYYALRMVVNGYEPVVKIPDNLREDWDIVREMAKSAWATNDEQKTYKIARNIEEYLKSRYEEEKAKKDEEKAKRDELKEKLEGLKSELEDLASEESEEGESSEEEGENAEDEENDDMESDVGDDEISSDTEESSEEGEESEEEGEEGIGSCKMPWEEEDEEEETKGKPGPGLGEEGEDEDDEETESEKSKGTDEEEKCDEDSEIDEPGSDESTEKEDRKEEIEKEIKETEKEIEKSEKEEEEADEKAKALDDKNAEIVDPTDAYEESEPTTHTYRSSDDVVPLPFDDYVKNYEVEAPKHSTRTKQILNECMGAVAGMAQRFIQKVRSRKHVGVRTYKGRVNRRKLHRYKFDRNIFKTQNLRQKKDAAVMIIVDCSGSMCGYKIETARKAALVIGEMMSQAKVEFEIKGFTVPYHAEYNFSCFTRGADLIHYRFGGSRDWNHSKHNVVEGDLPMGLADNDDGESLRQFAYEISKSPKDSKMMVVISDGAPCSRAQRGNGRRDLKNVIRETRESGIDLYAIGLNTDVGSYYGEDKSVRLDSDANTEELIKAIGQFVGQIANN